MPLHDKYKIWIGTLAIRRWAPYSLVGAAISLVTALVFRGNVTKSTRHKTTEVKRVPGL